MLLTCSMISMRRQLKDTGKGHEKHVSSHCEAYRTGTTPAACRRKGPGHFKTWSGTPLHIVFLHQPASAHYVARPHTHTHIQVGRQVSEVAVREELQLP